MVLVTRVGTCVICVSNFDISKAFFWKWVFRDLFDLQVLFRYLFWKSLSIFSKLFDKDMFLKTNFYMLWETYSVLMPILTRYTFSNSLKSVDPLLQPPLKNPRPAILQPNKTCVCVLPPTKYLGTRLAQQTRFSKCRLSKSRSLYLLKSCVSIIPT